MRKDSIDIMGARENLEKVKDFAWNIGKFGSTWLEWGGDPALLHQIASLDVAMEL